MAPQNLQLHECTSHRGCRAEQPCGRLQGQEPATYSRLRAKRVAEPAGCGCDPRRGSRHLVLVTVSEAPGRPCRAFGLRRPGTHGEIHPDHVVGSSSPGDVVSAALPPSGQRSGARYGLSPRVGRRLLHNLGRDCADGHPILVAHPSALLIRVEPAKAAKHVRLDSGSLPEGRSPCSTVRNMEAFDFRWPKKEGREL